MATFKNVMFVLLGVVCAVALFCAVVGIGSAVNDISFSSQIVEWFGSSSEVIEEVEEVVETAIRAVG